MKTNNEVSVCCNAEAKVECGDDFGHKDGTCHYECSECGKPCDILTIGKAEVLTNNEKNPNTFKGKYKFDIPKLKKIAHKINKYEEAEMTNNEKFEVAYHQICQVMMTEGDRKVLRTILEDLVQSAIKEAVEAERERVMEVIKKKYNAQMLIDREMGKDLLDDIIKEIGGEK